MREPLEGDVPWLPAPSLDVSVERSVRKLAFERRRRLFRKAGAMVAGDLDLSSAKQELDGRRGKDSVMMMKPSRVESSNRGRTRDGETRE